MDFFPSHSNVTANKIWNNKLKIEFTFSAFPSFSFFFARERKSEIERFENGD